MLKVKSNYSKPTVSVRCSKVRTSILAGSDTSAVTEGNVNLSPMPFEARKREGSTVD